MIDRRTPGASLFGVHEDAPVSTTGAISCRSGTEHVHTIPHNPAVLNDGQRLTGNGYRSLTPTAREVIAHRILHRRWPRAFCFSGERNPRHARNGCPIAPVR